MAIFRQAVRLLRRRSTLEAAGSPLLGSRSTAVGFAHLRSARLSHPPPSTVSPRFLSTNEPSSSRVDSQLEMQKEKIKEELINIYVRIHCKGSGTPDPSKAKVELNEALGKWEASMEKRSNIARDMVSSGEGGGGAGSTGWTSQQMLDRVAAPLAFVIMFLYCLRCQYPV
ncbi:uncharacterized protein LOC124655895 [Lolium rigidum]|uniref:uncharacterized protein LOC124655895 n=1 Tax=Lolium rigidum TaxID=89674 RepID=UPI001F5E1EE2|nr:uncharacterized protein LOC124655895 [Lolium rigidum]